MAQSADTSIDAGLSGLAVRNAINDNLAALFTSSSGPSAPSPTMGGMTWLDAGVSPPVLRVRNTANTAWLAVLPESVPAATVWGNSTGSAAALGSIDMTTLSGMLGFSSFYGSAGFQKLSGGLMLNWLLISSIASNANASVSFHTAFPSAAVFASIQFADFTTNQPVGGAWVGQLRDLSPVGMTVRNLGPGTGAFYCFAIGY